MVQKPEKAQFGTLEITMCNMTVIGPVVFEICSGNEVCVKTSLEIGHDTEPKVGQSSYTPKSTTNCCM